MLQFKHIRDGIEGNDIIIMLSIMSIAQNTNHGHHEDR